MRDLVGRGDDPADAWRLEQLKRLRQLVNEP